MSLQMIYQYYTNNDMPIMGKYIISWNDGNGSIRCAQYDPSDPTQRWKQFDVNGIGSIDNLSAPQIASLYQRRILVVWNS